MEDTDNDLHGLDCGLRTIGELAGKGLDKQNAVIATLEAQNKYLEERAKHKATSDSKTIKLIPTSSFLE